MKKEDKAKNRQKRKLRIRSKVRGKQNRPRLSVFRSNMHTYAQLIDDEKGITLVSASDLELEPDGKGETHKTKRNNGNTDRGKKSITSKSLAGSVSPGSRSKISLAYQVGELLARKALEKRIRNVVFDRNGYKYHGRIKALADGARKGGLNF